VDGSEWNHQYLNANGIRIHYVRHGNGSPLVLLHGWPEFWFGWRKNILPLAESFDVVAPDLRGFGDTEKAALPDPPSRLLEDYVEDLRGLTDALRFERIGIVSHDVGAYVAQAFARKYPERLSGLFFFNCPYPGIGERWVEPDYVNESWYQFGEDFDAWIDNFMKPGNLQGGFNWYISTNEGRIKQIRDGAPELPKIETPARVLWGESDSVLKVEWADRLGDYFANCDFSPAAEAGHFVHYERPDLANREMAKFFSGLTA
jgi:pimeloyl-ACP methyl ester carboxylesterase